MRDGVVDVGADGRIAFAGPAVGSRVLAAHSVHLSAADVARYARPARRRASAAQAAVTAVARRLRTALPA